MALLDDELTRSLALGVDEIVSVQDHNAFAAKHMPDLGHDVRDFKVFTWRFNNWTKVDKKVTSPEFECAGHRWRILLFPFGNTNTPPTDVVSVYIDHADPTNAPGGWHVCAQFALVMSNIYDPTIYSVSNAHHRFILEERDWGFTRFNELGKLLNVQEGHARPVIEGDSADISVYLRVVDDPTGVLWHSFVNYDSKKQTGYVGLRNQGATAYMNTILQSLYCIQSFRKALYQLPTEEDRPTESTVLALQRIFYRLQTSDQAVSTVELSKSFGWMSLDSFLPHDIVEFKRVLQDKLSSIAKGTQAEGAIVKLFEGQMKSYIKCIDIDFESSRLENFNDIELNVKGMRNLYDSFRDYVAVQTLEGENRYPVEGLGLQNAKMGVIFRSFPPVLHLQLKRCGYDVQQDAMVKINDRLEYPHEIDLTEFLDDGADRSTPCVYQLHGVLVHSGDLHQGHNYALIRPDQNTRWLKFDDDRVVPVTEREVLEGNFGQDPSNDINPPTMGRNQFRVTERFTSAYVLVYVLKSAIDKVLAPLREEDIPAHLKRREDEERLHIEAKKREREEQYLIAKVITDDTFVRHEGFDLATFDKNCPPSDLQSFRVLKSETYGTFKSRIARHFKHPENQIRLWVLVNRQNKTVRPDAPIPENEPTLTVEVIRNTMVKGEDGLRLYLDVIPDPSKPDPGYIMIFLKHFDASKQTLLGVGKIYVPKKSKVDDLYPIITERMRWKHGTPIKLYEEIKPSMIVQMEPKLTFAQSEIQDGDIICFQVDLPEKEVHDLEGQGLYSNPPLFYDFLQNRVMIIFRPKFEEPNHDHPEFHLTLSKKQNYDTMSQKVGDFLKHEPIRLRFTTTHPTNAQAKAILKRSLNQSIQEIVYPSYIGMTTVILYEKLDISIVELETKTSLKVAWTGIQNREEASHHFLLPKTTTIHGLADHLAKRVTLTPGGTGKIRVFKVSKDGKMQKEFIGNEMVGHIPDPVELYAEEILREELEVDDPDKVISVFHFSEDVSRTHGVPFKFVVKRGEKFAETKKRLQARIGVSDEELSKYRFALIQQPSYLENDDIIYDHQSPEYGLGLDHVDKSEKTRTGGGERVTVIRG